MSLRNAWLVPGTVLAVTRAGGGAFCTNWSGAGSVRRHDDLRVTVRARDEFAILIGQQQRHVVDIEVSQDDAQHFEACAFTSAQLPIAPATEPLAVLPSSILPVLTALTSRILHVFAQEHLVRGMRGIGLVLVDERGRGVFVLRHAVDHGDRRACQRHEIGAVVGGIRRPSSPMPSSALTMPSGPKIIQRVVRLQRDVHGAVAALGDEIEAMIEELAEEGHPGIEARRQADVGRLVRDGLEVGVGRIRQLAVCSGSVNVTPASTGVMPGWSASNCASDSGLPR